MEEREEHLLGLLKDVPREILAAQSKTAMVADSVARFRERVRNLDASQARVEPVHTALRSVLADSPQFGSVLDAMRSLETEPDLSDMPDVIPAPAPGRPRLKLGSFHLVDVPPFEAKTWQDSQGPYSWPPPTADGATGNMSLFVDTLSVGGPVHVSCWAGVGQFYFVPHDPSIDANGGLLRVSATPSFSWKAFWSSHWWRLASGDIWIGLTVNEFDSAGSFTNTPFSLHFPLISWNDYNADDSDFRSAQNTGFPIPQALVFVRPGFFYECLVMIGADAFGHSGDSRSTGLMNANVSSLILDTFDLV
jgi:hypothetical protein